MLNSFISPVTASDLEAIKPILDATELFPSDMLEDMIEPFLSDGECTDYWFAYHRDNRLLGFLFCEQERITLSTWNVLAIAVDPDFQSQGIGEALMTHIEQTLKAAEQSLLLVETSGFPQYDRTRAFYERIGYDREAEIRDYYEPGENKVIFSKSLTA